MGPTLVSYLRGAEVGAARIVVATTAAAATSMVGALWLAAAAAVGGCVVAATATVGGGAASAATAVSGPGLGPPAGGGEEWRIRSLKLCPPLVLTMPGLEKGRRWREWKDEDLFAKEEKGF